MLWATALYRQTGRLDKADQNTNLWRKGRSHEAALNVQKRAIKGPKWLTGNPLVDIPRQRQH